MTINETRRYMMLVRVRDFAEGQRDILTRVAAAQTHLDTLKGAITQIEAKDVTQLTSQSHGRSNRLARREALIGQLVDIAHTARDVAPDDPALRDAFPLFRYATDQALVNLGRAYAERAGARTAAFLENGMRDSFLADLASAIGELEQAVQASEQEKQQYASARDAIRSAFRVGNAAVRRLHRVMTNQLRGRDDLLADWTRARTMGPLLRKRGRRTRDGETPPSDVTPPATTAA